MILPPPPTPSHPIRATSALRDLTTAQGPTRLQRVKGFAGQWWPALLLLWLGYEVALPALGFLWLR
jgi:hypothetical protein